MSVLSLRPRDKGWEAAGCVGDGRIEVLDDFNARVTSSRGESEYRVIVVSEGRDVFRVYSSDNGTIYRRYVGYPIISFLIVKGVIQRNNKVINALKGIPWKDLNEKYKKYSIVEDIVLKHAESLGVQRKTVLEYVEAVMGKLKEYKFIFDETLTPQH